MFKKSLSSRNVIISSEPDESRRRCIQRIHRGGLNQAQPKLLHCSRIWIFQTLSKNFLENNTASEKSPQEQIATLSSRVIILFIRWYQRTVSPDHGMYSSFAHAQLIGCKFYPSCSAYAVTAIRQYGLFFGVVVSARRVLRCHPWSRGGYDPIDIKDVKQKVKDIKEKC